MSEQALQLPPPFPELESPLREKAQDYIPRLERARDNAVTAMAEWLNGGDLQDDEELAALTATLVTIRTTGEKMMAMRMELTKPLDDLKKRMMEYEKPLVEDDKKTSDYARCRAMITKYNQKKVNEKARIEREAAEKKILEQKLIEYKTAILQKLNNLLFEFVKKVEDACSAFFVGCPDLAEFDKRKLKFEGWKPKFPEKEYYEAFSSVLPKGWIEADPNNLKWKDALQSEEPYTKWHTLLLDKSLVIINEYRGKLPSMREDLQKLLNTKDQNERQRLADEQAAKDAADKKRRDDDLERQRVSESEAVQQQAQLDNLEANFREQAVIQQVEDAGATKLVLKFTDDQLRLKALSEIIYQSMARKEFPGFQKVVKGVKQVDEQGKPVYIEAVQWWIDFFLKYCDADVKGTTVFEYSKTVIKK